MALFDNIFGFRLKKRRTETQTSKVKRSSFVFPANTDGSLLVNNTNGLGAFNAYVDLDGSIRNEYQLITRYRDMTLQPEVDQAVNHIINDFVVQEPGEKTVEIILDKTDLSNSVKEKIREQFDTVCKLLDFNNQAYDICRRWYIDGRIYYHIEVNKERPKDGINNLVYIDPRQIKKIREIEIIRDTESNVDKIVELEEYYLYMQNGYFNTNNLNSDQGNAGSGAGQNSFNNNTYTIDRTSGMNVPNIQGAIKLSTDSVVYSHSNLTDPSCRVVVSHLHKAIRFVNLLRMLEDAIIIYRIARAPERRVFYIDTGGMAPAKAQEHLREVMNSYRNQTTYDAVTGETRDDKRHLSMLDDFWLPRGDKGSGTEVQNLSGGANLGEIQDLEYFQSKLYEALQVPVSRFKRADKSFSLGRTSEITQDELQFSRYIKRLRSRFCIFFDEILKKQLVLTKTLSEDEWESIKEDVYYEFNSDSHFSELKEVELLANRFNIMRDIKEYQGEFISKKWIQENILRMGEEDILKMDKQIEEESKKARELKIKKAELAKEIGSIIQPEDRDHNLDADPLDNAEANLDYINDGEEE
jgi:hypothetical protein